MTFVKLNGVQLAKKKAFVENYKRKSNPATASNVDANANVERKNIATLEAEINKDINIQINREIIGSKIEELYWQELRTEYIRQIEDHEIYVHDESSLKPYTYGWTEAIVVYKDWVKLLTTFEDIYDLYTDLHEECLDEEKWVWAKYPTSLEIDDINGRTKITRLIKKKRHRDMVRVKTKYWEDLIVTDNHPLIINKEDINDNVDAINWLWHNQYKKDISSDWDKNKFLPLEDWYENYWSYLIYKTDKWTKIEWVLPKVELDWQFWYAVWFFIAEWSYLPNGITMCQNDEWTLKRIASYIYNSTWVVGKIYKEEVEWINIKYKLDYNSRFLKDLFIDYFWIKSLAQNKNLPSNIYNLNDDFVNWLISWLIDWDWSVGRNISIRLASRSLISQLSILLRSYWFGISNTYQEQPEQAFWSFSSNYPIFWISFWLTWKLDLWYSDKVWNFWGNVTTNTRYKEWESEIISVTKIVNKAYLDNYIYDITTESNHFLCNNIQVHNCVSINMYPLLTGGMKQLGLEAEPPKHLRSFVGNFINLVYAVASQFAGAVATVEFLMYFDYFARKEFGDGYTKNMTPELYKDISQYFQEVVYSINQPASARGYQSVFWNISVYDEYYFDSLFGDFQFPDWDKPTFDSIWELQRLFLKWFNAEREKAVLTFPVVTVAMLVEDWAPKDEAFEEIISEEMAEGNAFFVYQSESADSLASCCRLRNAITDTTFSYSLWAGGVSTGSINVITVNFNRLIQDKRDLAEEIDKIHKYQIAYRKVMEEYREAGFLPVYDAWFISLDKQFLTIGINWMVEAAESLGMVASNNDEYKEWVWKNLKVIYDKNRERKKACGYLFNTEFVPAENLWVKNRKWDFEDWYIVPEDRNCYNSYFYVVEDEETTVIDKFILHWGEINQYLDWGSALHLNLSETLTKENASNILRISAKTGCNYFCTNVKITICNECNHINKETKQYCTQCWSKDVDYATRVIGYLKREKSFSKDRQIEANTRHYE